MTKPSKFKIILTDPEDATGQARAATAAIGWGWKPNDFTLVEIGTSLYAVKFNKKSVTVWTQKEIQNTRNG